MHPLLNGPLPSPLQLRSKVTLAQGETTIRATAAYAKTGSSRSGSHVAAPQDPLDDARSRNTSRWFVAGYGVARFLPDVGRAPNLDRPSIERMVPLFDSTSALTSTGFSRYFGDAKKALRFHRVLKHALLNVAHLLPDITDLELRGYGGVKRPGDLLERDRFRQRVGAGEALMVPGVALAHGYQSTIAWVADLVGHVLLEADSEVEPRNMEGVVLVDEIDLYLHPVWQATLIPALRATFPKLQFIVTTHSPVVLSQVAPHEVVHLESWGESGDVVEVVRDPETGKLVPAKEAGPGGVRPDARMMTGSEIFRDHFGIERPTPNPNGDDLRTYNMLASDPFRTDKENKEMLALRRSLTKHAFSELAAPVRRRAV